MEVTSEAAQVLIALEILNRAILDLREKRHQQLQEKVTLQHDLIQQQDLLFQQQRQEADDLRRQERELDRARRQARNDGYQEICRQSLDKDRKTKAVSKKSRKNSESKKKLEVTQSFPEKGMTHPLETLTQRQLSQFQSSLPPLCQTPPNIAIDSESDDDLTGDDLPWHHQQLYRMYGRKADYFLHPKLEPEVKQVVHPNLKKYEGGADADTLWRMLRDDSMAKLIAEDRTVPKELKAAYSAFVRQSMGHNCKPVKRNYYAEDDVPELERLLNQTQLRRVRNWQHKTDLMFRASQTNKDRTNVLLFNSPMPEVADKNTQESINQYLPSWLDDISEESLPEYHKWLRPKIAIEGTANDPIQEEDEIKPIEKQKTFDSELMQLEVRKKSANKKKYKFLTEAKATCKGQFAQRFKEQRDNKDIPQPAEGYHIPQVSQSAMSPLTERTEVDVRDCKSVPVPDSREAMLQQYTSQWQPLSMNALKEYKSDMEAPGEGDFGYGRPKMFTVTSVS